MPTSAACRTEGWAATARSSAARASSRARRDPGALEPVEREDEASAARLGAQPHLDGPPLRAAADRRGRERGRRAGVVGEGDRARRPGARRRTPASRAGRARPSAAAARTVSASRSRPRGSSAYVRCTSSSDALSASGGRPPIRAPFALSRRRSTRPCTSSRSSGVEPKSTFAAGADAGAHGARDRVADQLAREQLTADDRHREHERQHKQAPQEPGEQ